MKKFLLLSLLILALVPAFGQKRVFYSTNVKTTGCDQYNSIWHCNAAWVESNATYSGNEADFVAEDFRQLHGTKNPASYPGILNKTNDNINGNTAAGLSTPHIVVVRAGHNVFLTEHVLYNGTIIVESGATLHFNKPGGSKGRLTMDKTSQIIVKIGGEVIASSTNDSGLASDFIKIGDVQINGQKINALPVPVTLDVTINEPFLYCHNELWKQDGTNEEKLAKIIACMQQTPQPVDLLSLKVKASGSEVVTEWVVANELDFSHYVVEWSNDGLDFATAGIVSAKGTTNGTQRYSFQHTPGLTGAIYYRLIAVDVDGSEEQKGNVQLVRLGAEQFTVHANGGRLLINYNGPEQTQVALIDTMGRVLSLTSLSEQGLATTGLKPGMYLVQISNVLEKKTQRIVIR